MGIDDSIIYFVTSEGARWVEALTADAVTPAGMALLDIRAEGAEPGVVGSFAGFTFTGLQ